MAAELPDDFKCPISLEIMTDPVILSSGHTFDRSSIQRWLDSGHRTCPITKLPIPDHPSLIPNHALRSLISNYTLASFSDQRSTSHDSLQTLTPLFNSTSNSKLDTLDRLTRLSKQSSAFRTRLAESGAVSAALNCLALDDPCLQEKALNLLLNLSLDDNNKVGLVAEGAIGGIVSALHGGTPSCRAVAATMLTSLAVVEVNKATIGAYPFAISSLVCLLEDGKARETREAATALFTLCLFPANRRLAVESGAVPILFGLADKGHIRAVEVLSLLARCKEGRDEIRKLDATSVSILVRVLKNASSRGVQYALLMLNSICSHDEKMCSVARELGIVAICGGLLEDENPKIGRNASSLIQILQGN